jgi:hypothetical protein
MAITDAQYSSKTNSLFVIDSKKLYLYKFRLSKERL